MLSCFHVVGNETNRLGSVILGAQGGFADQLVGGRFCSFAIAQKVHPRVSTGSDNIDLSSSFIMGVYCFQKDKIMQ